MKQASFHILRVSIAITFLWIGVLIIRQPEAWGGYLMPWAVKLLPVSLSNAMISTAIFDILIGFFLLIDSFTWLAAAFAIFHIAVVLITSGISDITVRDLGLLGASIALMVESIPTHLSKKQGIVQ